MASVHEALPLSDDEMRAIQRKNGERYFSAEYNATNSSELWTQLVALNAQPLYYFTIAISFYLFFLLKFFNKWHVH